MTEGRKTQIVLLDERRLEILIQPKLSAGELLDLVASHFSLKEKEYFGLSFKDDTGHHHWLQLDRRVLDHDFPKKTGPLVLYFAVRFFIETIAYLNDNATVELFYLQAKQSIFRGHLECDGETAFELAAHVLQATYGDYIDDVTTKKTLKKLPVLPTSALKEHPSIAYCEDRVIENYQKLAGQSRGSSIVNYMTIVESIPTYGIHYYEVKDKSGIPWWLGLSYKGVSLYDYADKKIPRRVFAWKQLENLYFRDKKFSIEVHDPKRIVHTLSSFNLYEDAIQEPIEDFDDLSDAISDPTTQVSVSRRTFGPGNVNVHAWLAATPQLTKCIWSMAVSQHQFYLDRKQSKSQLPQVRSMSEIAADLCRSTSSLQSSGASESISRSNSAHSLTVSLSTNNSRTELSQDEIEASRAAQRDMYAALKARKDALEETLRKKTEILRELCIQEGELIGELPIDTPLVPGEPRPQIRRRMGTEFSLSPKLINRDKASEEEEAIAKLELDFDIQDKIVKAAFKLAQDKTVGKTVRKQRKQSYHKSNLKLKDLEKKLNEFRKHAGKTPLRAQSSCEDSEFISPRHTPAAPHRYNVTGHPQVKIIASPHESLHRNSAPASPVRHVMSTSRGSTPSPSPSRRYLGAVGVLQSSGRMQYRPYDSRSLSSGGSHSEYEAASNGTSTCNRPTNHVSQENIHNWYNVNTTKTARYSSTDELKSPPSNIEQYDSFDDQRQWPRPPDSSELGYDDRVPMNHPNDYNSYENYEQNVPDDILLPELTPSKFGSKRESTSDYRDSKYHFVDMCPPVDSMPAQDLPPPPQSEHGYMPQHRHIVPHAPYEDYRGAAPTGERTPGSNIPFIDNSSSHGSLHSSSASSTNWYEPKDSPLRQQARPETPQYEPQPAGCVRQEPLPPPTQNEAGDHSESPVMTVTKFQSYVEVSKPFEMSDFYKYSEKLRRQRGVEHQSPPPHSSSHSQHRLQSPYMSRSANFTSGPARGSQGYYSSNHHPPSSRSRPSSPYSQQQQQQQQDGSYVMQQKVASSHSSFQTARTRQVPGNMAQQGTYHGQQTPGYPSTQISPRHTSYQPPQPMTCEPVREPRPGSRSTPQTPHTHHRSMNDSKEGSFGSYGCEDEGVAEAFSEEMLAWYAGKGPANSSTLV